MAIRKNCSIERVAKHRKGLPNKVIESPAFEMFKRHVDVTLKDTVL